MESDYAVPYYEVRYLGAAGSQTKNDTHAAATAPHMLQNILAFRQVGFQKRDKTIEYLQHPRDTWTYVGDVLTLGQVATLARQAVWERGIMHHLYALGKGLVVRKNGILGTGIKDRAQRVILHDLKSLEFTLFAPNMHHVPRPQSRRIPLSPPPKEAHRLPSFGLEHLARA